MRRSSVAHARARALQAALAATTAGLGLALASCGSSGGHPSSASGDSTASIAASTPSPDPSDIARAKILTAYQGFWKIQEQAYSSSSLDGVPINTYALGQAAADIRSTLTYYQSQHEVMRGRPVLSPVVSALNLVAGTASITDCIDTTGFLPVDATTGKAEKLSSDVHRHPWTFTAQFDHVQWRILTGTIDRAKTC